MLKNMDNKKVMSTHCDNTYNTNQEEASIYWQLKGAMSEGAHNLI